MFLLCPLCGSQDCWVRLSADSVDVHVAGFFYRLCQCAKCGLQFIHPKPSSELLEELYGEGFYSEAKHDDLISRLFAWYEELCYQDRFRILRERREGLRLLDVGSGNGHFLAFMRRKGWHIYGVESSRAGVEVARRQFNVDVFHGSLEQAAFPPSQFDAITLWHVLEHITDPLATLKEVNRILKASGKVVVAVPNVESIEAAYLKEKWALFDLPRHQYGFSPRTIRLLFRAAGLQVICIKHFSLEYSIPIALQGLLNLVGDHNFMYSLIKKRKRYCTEWSPRLLWNVFTSFGFSPFALLPAVVLATLSWLVRRGTSIVVVARGRKTGLECRSSE